MPHDSRLAREQYFPATIAVYAPKRMDTEFPMVREAHDRNDETVERIYIGRRFKNDTVRNAFPEGKRLGKTLRPLYQNACTVSHDPRDS